MIDVVPPRMVPVSNQTIDYLKTVWPAAMVDEAIARRALVRRESEPVKQNVGGCS